MEDGWIGVDLDGTLVRTSDWRDMEYVGAPIPEMAARVKGWLTEGRDVRIFTTRVAPLFCPDTPRAERLRYEKAQWAIEDWCAFHFGQKLPVTAVKDFGMALLYDDRCVPIETDTGRVMVDDAQYLDTAAPGVADQIAPGAVTVQAGRYRDLGLWEKGAEILRHLALAAAACFPISDGRMPGK